MKNEIIVLDIETTGLNPNEDFILELGMVKLNLDNGEITTLFNQVFKDPNLRARHHKAWIFENGFMSVEEIRNALPISYYFDEIQNIFDQHVDVGDTWPVKFPSFDQLLLINYRLQFNMLSNF